MFKKNRTVKKNGPGISATVTRALEVLDLPCDLDIWKVEKAWNIPGYLRRGWTPAGLLQTLLPPLTGCVALGMLSVSWALFVK